MAVVFTAAAVYQFALNGNTSVIGWVMRALWIIVILLLASPIPMLMFTHDMKWHYVRRLALLLTVIGGLYLMP